MLRQAWTRAVTRSRLSGGPVSPVARGGLRLRHLHSQSARQALLVAEMQRYLERRQRDQHRQGGSGARRNRDLPLMAVAGGAAVLAACGLFVHHGRGPRSSQIHQMTISLHQEESEQRSAARSAAAAAVVEPTMQDQLVEKLQSVIALLRHAFSELANGVTPKLVKLSQDALALLREVRPRLQQLYAKLLALLRKVGVALVPHVAPAAVPLDLKSSDEHSGVDKSGQSDSAAASAGATTQTDREKSVEQKAVEGEPGAVQAQSSFYNKYGWLIIGGSILGAALGVLLSRRALDAESAKIAAQRVEEAARSTMPAHPRRASVGGPLQSSNEHAALVREALELISASPAAAAALGTPPYREGRLQTLKPKGFKGGAVTGIAGNLPLKSGTGMCSVAIKAHRNEHGVACESLVIHLPSGEALDVPIVSDASSSPQ